VIDEMGYLPMDDLGATIFFQLVSARYERGSIILTSNKSYGDWGTIFGDPIIATAILDRLLHHSTTINIRGESYRLKERRRAGLLPRTDQQGQETILPKSAIVRGGDAQRPAKGGRIEMDQRGEWTDFAAVKAAVGIERLLDGYGVKLRAGSGAHLRGRCPLPQHSSWESRESFIVNTSKNVWVCHSQSCVAARGGQAGGNVLDLVAVMENCSHCGSGAAAEGQIWGGRAYEAELRRHWFQEK
jgi:hypothetical protein